ncbi:MAG: hypothetical protein Q8P32_01885 [Candidatus Komeilibacteria bacterium]|nr:hypothetical protein [Candidatus Komeilibacteria bacterium]
MKKIFNQSETVKISVISLLLVLVVLIYDRPILGKINKFHATVKAEIANLEANSEQGNSFTKATLDWQQFSEKLPVPAELLMPRGQELELIKQLEAIAAKYQLDQELTLGQDYQAWSEKIDQLGLSAKLTGQFSDLIAYLSELEKLNFQLTVDSVTVKPKVLTESAGQIEAMLLINTYWLR